MKSKTKVVGDAAGIVVVPSQKNAEYGYVLVVQDRIIFDDNGFMSKQPVSAIVKGTIEDLKSMGWKADQELEGKVVIKESLTPFSKKQPESDIKIAGKTEVVCTLKGAPIYRKTVYTTNLLAEDLFVKHDNTEEIVAKQAAMKLAEAGTIGKELPKKDFSL